MPEIRYYKCVKRGVVWLGLIVIGGVALVYLFVFSPTYVSPDDKKQSRFLGAFNPVPLLKSMQTDCTMPGQVVTRSSASAGSLSFVSTENVQFERGMELQLCGHYAYPAMLTAVHQQALATLGLSGCRAVSDELSAEQGVRIEYRCGARTAGLMTMSPPHAMAGGEEGQFSLKLEVKEEWAVRAKA
jgi:hypothetical protein